ncbi:MAG TPA: DUF4239 domain-containing protein [Thermoanaerobaculia bacterium]|nr:DUF4239 domain-containing protein [Thermoanaerobaculia bacterium]
MNFTFVVVLVAVGLFGSTLATLELGRRLGQRAEAHGHEGTGAGTVETAVFALLGLVIALTFSGAVDRLDSRRKLVAVEANAVGTAWLRLDLLPADTQPQLRDLFRRYLDTRLRRFRALSGGRPDEAAAAAAETATMQGEIWKASVSACRASESMTACLLLVPALNEMFDITTTRTMSARIHPPFIVFLMLAALALASSLLAGYAMGSGQTRSPFHRFAFALVIAATVYVIVDLEYPRLGMIEMSAADAMLEDVRKTMR